MVVITVGSDKMEAIRKQISQMPLNVPCRIIDSVTFLSVYYCYFHDMIYINAVNFSVTQLCSLSCKKCSVLTPYIKQKKHYPIEQLYKETDTFFKVADLVDRITIVGGEPFVYPWLKEFICYLAGTYSSKIQTSWYIITNGTIVPDDGLMEVIQQYGGEIQISDYTVTLPHLRKTIDQLVDRCNQKHINVSVYKADRWIDFGYEKLNKCGDSEEDMIRFFDNCHTPCRLVQDGGIYYCANSKAAMNAGMMVNDTNNFFDLKKFTMDRRKHLMEFDLGFNSQGYIDMCKKCNGYLTINRKWIDVAVQV